MNVGVTSAMIMCARLIPHIIPTGHVILLSGTFADGGASWLPYYTSKRALEDFLEGLASDEDKVKVYGISPADTATESYQRFYPESAASAQPPEAIASICLDAINEKLGVTSGTVIEVRNGQVALGFHK